MIKHLRDFLKAYWKEHGTKHIKIHKSKILIYDEHLNKYVTTEELLIPAKVTTGETNGVFHQNKSKELWFIAIILRKFINPKLDLLVPGAKDISQIYPNVGDNKIGRNSLGPSSRSDLLWSKKDTNNNQLNLTLSTVNFSSKSVDLPGIGWNGQIVGRPYSDPRPEHSNCSSCLQHSGNDPIKKEAKKRKSKACTYYLNAKEKPQGEKSKTNNNAFEYSFSHKSPRQKNMVINDDSCFTDEKIIARSNFEDKQIKKKTLVTQHDNEQIEGLTQKTKSRTNILKKLCAKLFTDEKSIKMEHNNNVPNTEFSNKSNKYIETNNILGNIEKKETCSSVSYGRTTNDNIFTSHAIPKNNNIISLNNCIPAANNAHSSTKPAQSPEINVFVIPKKEPNIIIFEKPNSDEKSTKHIETREKNSPKIGKQPKKIKIKESIQFCTDKTIKTSKHNMECMDKQPPLQNLNFQLDSGKVNIISFLSTNLNSATSSKYNFVVKPKQLPKLDFIKNQMKINYNIENNKNNLKADCNVESKALIPIENKNNDFKDISKNNLKQSTKHVKCLAHKKEIKKYHTELASTKSKDEPTTDVCQHLKVNISKVNKYNILNCKNIGIPNTYSNVSVNVEPKINNTKFVESKKCLPLLQCQYIEQNVSEKLNQIALANCFNEGDISLEMLQKKCGTYMGFKICNTSPEPTISKGEVYEESIDKNKSTTSGKSSSEMAYDTTQSEKVKRANNSVESSSEMACDTTQSEQMKKANNSVDNNYNKGKEIRKQFKSVLFSNEERTFKKVSTNDSKQSKTLTKNKITSVNINNVESKADKTYTSNLLKNIGFQHINTIAIPVGQKEEKTKPEYKVEPIVSEVKKNIPEKSVIVDEVEFPRNKNDQFKETSESGNTYNCIRRIPTEKYSGNELTGETKLIKNNNNDIDDGRNSKLSTRPGECSEENPNLTTTKNITNMNMQTSHNKETTETNNNKLHQKEDVTDNCGLNSVEDNNKKGIKHQENPIVTKCNSLQTKKRKNFVNKTSLNAVTERDRPWKRCSTRGKTAKIYSTPKSYAIVKKTANKKLPALNVNKIITKKQLKSEIDIKTQQNKFKKSKPIYGLLDNVKKTMNNITSMEFPTKKAEIENTVKSSTSLPNLTSPSQKFVNSINKINNVSKKFNTVMKKYSDETTRGVKDNNIIIPNKHNRKYNKLCSSHTLEKQLAEVPLKSTTRVGIKSFGQSKLTKPPLKNSKMSSDNAPKYIWDKQAKIETYFDDSNDNESLSRNNNYINTTSDNLLKNNKVNKVELRCVKIPLGVHKTIAIHSDNKNKHLSTELKSRPSVKSNQWDELQTSLKSKRFPKNIVKRVNSQFDKSIVIKDTPQRNEESMSVLQNALSNLDNQIKKYTNYQSNARFVKCKERPKIDIADSTAKEPKSIQKSKNIPTSYMKNESVVKYKDYTNKEQRLLTSNSQDNNVNKFNKSDNQDQINRRFVFSVSNEDRRKLQNKSNILVETNIINISKYSNQYLNVTDNKKYSNSLGNSTMVNNSKAVLNTTNKNKLQHKCNFNTIKKALNVKINNDNQNHIGLKNGIKHPINEDNELKKNTFNTKSQSNFSHSKKIYHNYEMQNNNGEKYRYKNDEKSSIRNKQTIINENLVNNSTDKNKNALTSSTLKDFQAVKNRETSNESFNDPTLNSKSINKIKPLKPLSISNLTKYGSKQINKTYQKHKNSISNTISNLPLLSIRKFGINDDSGSKLNDATQKNNESSNLNEKLTKEIGVRREKDSTGTNYYKSNCAIFKKGDVNNSHINKNIIIKKIMENEQDNSFGKDDCYVTAKNRHDIENEEGKNKSTLLKDNNNKNNKVNNENHKYRNCIVLKTYEPYSTTKKQEYKNPKLKNKLSKSQIRGKEPFFNIQRSGEINVNDKKEDKSNASKDSFGISENSSAKVHSNFKSHHPFQSQKNLIVKTKNNLNNKPNCNRINTGVVQSKQAENNINAQKCPYNAKLLFGSHPNPKNDNLNFKAIARKVESNKPNINSLTKIMLNTINNKNENEMVHTRFEDSKNCTREKTEDIIEMKRIIKMNDYVGKKNSNGTEYNTNKTSNLCPQGQNLIKFNTLKNISTDSRHINLDNKISDEQSHYGTIKKRHNITVKNNVKNDSLKVRNSSSEANVRPSKLLKTKKCPLLDKRLQKISKRKSLFKQKRKRIKVIY